MNIENLDGIQKNELIKQLLTIIEYMETTFHIRSIHQLLNETANFLVQTLKISNTTITIDETTARYYTNQQIPQTYSDVENKLIKELQDLKTNIKIKSAKEDYLTKNIQNIQLIPQNITAMPLIKDKEFLGMTTLYSEKEINNTHLTEEILRRMINMIEKITDYNTVQKTAITDPLTGLYNRAFMTQTLKEEIEQLEKEKKPITLAMIDVDNFKNFNDTKGHLEGDRILIEIAQKIKQSIKAKESACRYGGEEFLLILPETTQQQALEKLETLRKQIQQECELTISIGTITSNKSDLAHSIMLKQSDEALYQAKRTGKNKIIQYISIDKSLGIINVTTAENFGKTL